MRPRVMAGVCLLAVGLAGPAAADDVVWTFGSVGDIGPLASFLAAGKIVNLAGFAAGAAADMFGKQNAPADFGLGLAVGPAQEIGTIQVGQAIDVTIPAGDLLTCPCNFSIESLDVGETFQIRDTLGHVLASGGADAATPGIAHVILPTEPADSTFVVTAGDAASSVLLDEVSATAAVPEPATLVLLGTGLVGLGYKARRRLTS